MSLEIAKVHELCDYVFYGMSLKEAFILSNVNFEELSSPTSGPQLRQTLLYAKHKAKYQLMHMAHELAMSEKPNLSSVRMLQHLVSSRCDYTENRRELKLKQRQHEELMDFRRQNMRNWSDFQAAKMIASASGQQLQDFQLLSLPSVSESKDKT